LRAAAAGLIVLEPAPGSEGTAAGSKEIDDEYEAEYETLGASVSAEGFAAGSLARLATVCACPIDEESDVSRTAITR